MHKSDLINVQNCVRRSQGRQETRCVDRSRRAWMNLPRSTDLHDRLQIHRVVSED